MKFRGKMVYSVTTAQLGVQVWGQWVRIGSRHRWHYELHVQINGLTTCQLYIPQYNAAVLAKHMQQPDVDRVTAGTRRLEKRSARGRSG